MQISDDAGPGDVVHVRGQRWRVLDVRPYGACTEIALDGAGAGNLGVRQRVLAPFDRVERTSAPARAHRASRSEWRRACRGWFAENTPPGCLRAAHRASIDLRPHQLEPALAIVRGRAARVLLADAVGLGKTIQAALIVAELGARGAADRVLVLAPAGLRDQWQSELHDRFGLEPIVIDAPELRRRAAMLPGTVNPWTTIPLAIASVDFVKQPHVLPAVTACRWDVVAIDEAHGVAGDSERRNAARAICACARYVLLLSATPHNGDRRQFDELCALGAHGDPLLVVRRTRQDVPLACRRKVTRLQIATGPAERRMHAALDAFGREVRRGASRSAETWLALAVLHKRALSTPAALGRSVARRLATLAAADTAADAGGGATPRQMPLPLADPSGELTPADAAPEWPAALTLADARRERAWLQRLAASARDAEAESSKIAALARLLRRVGEPAIVFTEYRDTLVDLVRRLGRPAAMLHGGLSRAERTRACDAFTSGRQSLLLATDAAAEGLNLQARCRLVINLELPWNPMRLEQRIGRVDRIGQRRTVHAVHLIAAGTGEARLVAYLRSKIAQARSQIGAADPLDNRDELTAARVAIAGLTPQPDSEWPAPDDSIPGDTDLLPAAEASAEAARLADVRRLASRGVRTDAARGRGTLLGIARRQRTRRELNGRTLLLVRVSMADGLGRPAESLLLPLAARSDSSMVRQPDVTSGDSLETIARRVAGPSIDAWHRAAVERHAAFAAAALRRERAIRDAALNQPAMPLFQPELFSRRADREREREQAWIAEANADASARIDWLVSASALGRCRFELLLVLRP